MSISNPEYLVIMEYIARSINESKLKRRSDFICLTQKHKPTSTKKI
jgi:CDP-diacylglycerol pyrophosphatase